MSVQSERNIQSIMHRPVNETDNNSTAYTFLQKDVEAGQCTGDTAQSKMKLDSNLNRVDCDDIIFQKSRCPVSWNIIFH